MNNRDIAYNILYEINNNKAYSNIIINKKVNKLDKKDDSFIRELVYGVIENKIYLDYVISKFSKIKLKKISPAVKDILRLGIYQIIFLDKVPDSAACNESVKLTKKHSHKGTYGFVNGTLRNISRNKNKIELPDKEKNPVEYLSIKFSHPEWLVKRWLKDFGYNFTKDLCQCNNAKPEFIIRTNTLKTSREDLIKKLEIKDFIVSNTIYANDGILIKNPSRITDIEEYKKGLFTIQDESSMLVAQIMDPKEGSFVVDLCSAPGGKATHIAQIMNNKGKVISRDIHKHKLKLIIDNTNRLGINIIDTEHSDALKLDNTLVDKVDYCLVDAPCSGFGIIRRKPEIKYNKTEDDINEINKIQYKILENASKYVKKGGVIIYSTCTIEKEENRNLVEKFLKNNTMFTLEKTGSILEKDNEGIIELYPNIHGTDGFFIAKLKRNS